MPKHSWKTETFPNEFQPNQIYESPVSDAPLEYQAQRLYQILLLNKDKNFVDRILHSENYPTIQYKSEGDWGTHAMASGEWNGKNIVFPLIQWDGEKLNYYENPREAWMNALRNNDYITFDNREDAEFFGAQYKKIFGEQHGGPSSWKKDLPPKEQTQPAQTTPVPFDFIKQLKKGY